MNVTAIAEKLRHMDEDGILDVGPSAGSASAWLHEVELPPVLRELLATCWPRDERLMISHGEFDFWPVRRIKRDEDSALLLRGRLLPIGQSSFADLVAVDLDTPDDLEVGLVSHTLLWETQTPARDCYRRICGTLLEFVDHVAAEKPLPHDYFAVPA